MHPAVRTYYSPNSTWLVTSRRAEPMHFGSVELVEQHGLTVDTLVTTRSNVSCRVETYRDEPSGIWANTVKLYSLTHF